MGDSCDGHPQRRDTMKTKVDGIKLAVPSMPRPTRNPRAAGSWREDRDRAARLEPGSTDRSGSDRTHRVIHGVPSRGTILNPSPLLLLPAHIDQLETVNGTDVTTGMLQPAAWQMRPGRPFTSVVITRAWDAWFARIPDRDSITLIVAYLGGPIVPVPHLNDRGTGEPDDDLDNPPIGMMSTGEVVYRDNRRGLVMWNEDGTIVPAYDELGSPIPRYAGDTEDLRMQERCSSPFVPRSLR
jgi:hypothetical protein